MRIVTLTSNGGQVTSGQHGVKIGLAVRGTGLPNVSTQWFEGAGDGATFRGGRFLSRVIDLPVTITGSNREQIRQRMSNLGNIFSLSSGSVRLAFELDGDKWFTDVYRTGGGDWLWSEDTDGKTFVKTVLTVQAGNPFWIHDDEDSRVVTLSGFGRGLIKTPDPRLTMLKVSTNAGFGTVTFQNQGDVPAYPRWIIGAPFNGFSLISQSGETLTWTGAKTEGFIEVNSELGTVVDENGVNQYGGLNSVPRFWALPQGDSIAQVIAEDATSLTQITAYWRTKRWVMF
jgi:hypothetical protein